MSSLSYPRSPRTKAFSIILVVNPPLDRPMHWACVLFFHQQRADVPYRWPNQSPRLSIQLYWRAVRLSAALHRCTPTNRILFNAGTYCTQSSTVHNAQADRAMALRWQRSKACRLSRAVHPLQACPASNFDLLTNIVSVPVYTGEILRG